MGNLRFFGMSLAFKFRDWAIPPRSKLDEARVERGFSILDFGCGPGSFALAAAELVGAEGQVYAVDIRPHTVQRLQKIASNKGLSNIKTICSDCSTGLEDNSLDVVLLYDVFHEINKPDAVLEELHRVLKQDSVLSFSDHHMKESQILSKVTGRGLFTLSQKTRRTYSFTKADTAAK